MRARRFSVLAVAMVSWLALVASAAPQAHAYGGVGTLDMWQVGLSFNCNNPSACAPDLGGFWGWAQFTRDPATRVTDADAELTGCQHATGGAGFAGAFHSSIDVTSWVMMAGHLSGDPSGAPATTFWVTGGTETDSFRGQSVTGPITDDNGNPVTPSNPMDTGIPVNAGHYSTTAIFGLVPPPGISFQIQVAFKPAG